MKRLNQKARRTFDLLIEGLTADNPSRRIDNAGGTFMAVSVERLGERQAGTIYSVTHYYEQNGDLVTDPDMTFLVANDGRGVYPLTFEQGGRLYQEAVIWSTDRQTIVSYRPRMQRELTHFANLWMNNIRRQQRLTARRPLAV